MAKTIIAFSGTPRKGGNSEILADRILAGAAQAGATVERIRLHDLAIAPCTACEACLKSVEEPCVLEDDMAALLDKVRAADAIVLASPIYFFTVNAQMKVFLDRWFALFASDDFNTLRGKGAVVALTYADSDPLSSGVTNAMSTFRDACRFLGINLAGWVHASCSAAGEVASNETALRAAHTLGRKLAEA